MSAVDLRAQLFGELPEPFTAEALFDCLHDVVFFVKDRGSRYVVVNRTLVERCGFRTKNDLVGRTADEVFPPPLGRSYRIQDEDVLRAGRPIRDQLELHIYPSGRRGWCLTSKLPLHGRNGAVVGLYGYSKDLSSAAESSEDLTHVAAALQRIRTHFGEPLHVGELAAVAGLSVYQFEQRVRRIFQVTAGQLIQKVRMEAAVERLVGSDEPIAAVAIRCGYADQSAFTRKFRAIVGYSPAEYRRNFGRIERKR